MAGSYTDVPLARMKFTLFGSTPSAIQATLTPAPVIPSERAVFAFGLVESVCVSDKPSGSSCTWPFGPQAPGITLGVSDVLAPLRAVFEDAAGVTGAGVAPLMVTSGMTSGYGRIGFQPRHFARRHRRCERVHEPIALDVGGMHFAKFAHERCLVSGDGVGSRGSRTAADVRGRELALHDDDHVTVDVLRQLSGQRRSHRALRPHVLVSRAANGGRRGGGDDGRLPHDESGYCRSGHDQRDRSASAARSRSCAFCACSHAVSPRKAAQDGST